MKYQSLFSWKNKKKIYFKISAECFTQYSKRLWDDLDEKKNDGANIDSENIDYYPFDITWKDVFAWRFILNEKKNILTDHILSETIFFFFSVSVSCSQIFSLKVNLNPKIGLTYTISIVKYFFNFCL